MKIKANVPASEKNGLTETVSGSIEYTGLFEEITNPSDRLQAIADHHGVDQIVAVLEDGARVKIQARMRSMLVKRKGDTLTPSGITQEELQAELGNWLLSVGDRESNKVEKTLSDIDKMTEEQEEELWQRMLARRKQQEQQ